MPRDGRVVRARLQQAALELFGERGFDDTTTENIAVRAGVTERTYFRHFSDKREVFFDGEVELRDVLVRGVAAVAEGTAPMPTLLAAFHSAVPLLERNRPVSEPRSRIIARTPPLQERELVKTASLVETLSTVLQGRGVDARRARLSAQVGMGVFAITTQSWLRSPAPDLHEQLDAAFVELRAVAGEL